MHKAIRRTLLLLLTLTTGIGCFATSAYNNSNDIPAIYEVKEPGDGDGFGNCGDPYMMKYDGTYYLYCSTGSPGGFRVWSSKDMANWTYRGNAGLESERQPISKGAYAPEVTYWNGKFYLYASCGEQIHRLYVADSPTGPFKFITTITNIIDGNLFIDDDENATRYFFVAGNACLKYTNITTSMMKATSGLMDYPALNICNGWTEGPTLFKRNGKYYITYTGNHVWSEDYRIEYAVGDSVMSLKEPEENLLLVNSTGLSRGPGHNSVVIGPNLDTYYACYHTMLHSTPEVDDKLGRKMNIDRLVFNGEKMEAWGPTLWEIENPEMPEFYDYMTKDSLTDHWTADTFAYQNGYLTSAEQGVSLATAKYTTPDNYSAEFNLRPASKAADSKAGAVLSYADERNYAYAYIAPAENKLVFKMVVDGKETVADASLPEDNIYNATTLHKLTVKKDGKQFNVAVDDRYLISATDESGTLGAGAAKLRTENCLTYYSFSALSSAINGSGDVRAEKPTGSAMDAVLANETSRTFTTEAVRDSKASIDSYAVTDVTAGDSLSYQINPQQNGYYEASIKARSAAGATVRLTVDGKTVVRALKIGASEDFAYTVSDKLYLDKNAKTFKFEVIDGTLDLYSVTLEHTDAAAPTVEQDMTFKTLEANWSRSGTVYTGRNPSTFGLAAYGSERYADYTFSTDITRTSGTDCGVMVRLKYATTTADLVHGIGGGSQGNPNYHYGYYVQMTSSQLVLGKRMFDWKVLTRASMSFKNNTTYRIKVTCRANNIKVYVDDQLCIDYTDQNQPILTGKVGLRNNHSVSAYSNIRLVHENRKPEDN